MEIISMKIYFGQLYIQAGISFPFSSSFQRFLSEEVSKLVEMNPKFEQSYGTEYELMFRISAKKELLTNEICGPTIFKKEKDIEYSIFLPYKFIMEQSNPNKCALEFLFEGIYTVLDLYEINTSRLKIEQNKIINKIISSSNMFKDILVY